MNEAKTKTKATFTLRELILVSLVVAIITGAGTGLLLNNKSNSETSSVKTSEKVDSKFQVIVDTFNNIKNNFYQEVDDNTLINGAISGMLDSVDDPYTTFMEKQTYSNFNISLNGKFKGFGIEVSTIDNKITVVGIFNDSPAAKAGFKLGDVFVTVDDKKASEMTANELTDYIKSKPTDDFVVVLDRDGEQITINITKDVVELKSVTSQVFERDGKKIGYLYASIFANNTYQQFREELIKLEQQNIDSLIIDLRDNTGGELTAALNMISLFIKNDKVAFMMESRTGTIKYNSNGLKDAKYPIALLVNSNSASASEVMTSALKENINATVIGTTTYGKGTAQELLNLSNGEQYKMTTMKWLTPKGNWINGTGIKPDVEVEMNENYYKNPSIDNDNQLQTAINYLKEH